MKSSLNKVTFTGVDERADLGVLSKLSTDYPFIEWGVLLSQSRCGKEPRYPSLACMQHIGLINVRKSVHLCGALAKDAGAGVGFPFETARQLVHGAERIQINLGNGIGEYQGVFKSALRYQQTHGINMIIQMANFDNPYLASNLNPSFLHDASGGRGISGNFQYPPNHQYVGYAGGISPENITSKLEQIQGLWFDNYYWIDMESGVRTDDWLDLDKCEHVAKIAAAWMAG